jgi:hypothetical protein
MDNLRELVLAIAQVGRKHPNYPSFCDIEAFRPFFDSGKLKRNELDARDGACTRRELLVRHLVLSAVLDQGPDIQGVRQMMALVVNDLYRKEVRIFHQPLLFFRELGISIDQILEKHASVKAVRAQIWAKANQSNADRYNLFMDNSTQALNYAVFRWGVPLALPHILDKDCKDDEKRPTVLIDYLESASSAEKMSHMLKDSQRYGLGKAIGDKACHLFAKWFCTSYALCRKTDSRWGPFSYEVPFDSNAGRVLWRTGFFLKLATLKEYADNEVIQEKRGKGKSDYIRVTNIRGMGVSATIPQSIRDAHAKVAIECLGTHSIRPTKVQIQRIPHALMYDTLKRNDLGVADLDEGLIHIGTSYCYNHDSPNCKECPISTLCEGYQSKRELIQKYRT